MNTPDAPGERLGPVGASEGVKALIPTRPNGGNGPGGDKPPPWSGDGSLVKEQSNPAVYVMCGGAKLHIPSPAEFDACGYDWARVHTLPDGTLAPVPLVPHERTLFQQRSNPDVWLLHAGARLLIPTHDAAVALGVSEAPTHTVPLGSVNHIPAVRILGPSPGSTPSSFIFPPQSARYYAPPKAKWWPRTDVPGFTLPNGARVVELRGWLTAAGESPAVDAGPNDGDPDWHLNLEPDPAWLDAIGIDWHTFFKVGDILAFGAFAQDKNKHHAYVARPCIHMEVVGFALPGGPWHERNKTGGTDAWPASGGMTQPPRDWTVAEGETGESGVIWPYLPSHDVRPGGQALQGGEYVSVSGSLVSDIPHVTGFSEWLNQIVGVGSTTDYKAAAGDWDAGHDEDDERCPARWTEMHPPDLITLVDEPPARHEYVYGVAVVARAHATQFSSAEQELTAALAPPGARPAHHHAVAREYVGPETNFGTITEGNDARNGARITPSRDCVWIHVKVVGGPFAGVPGKFKAVYRVSWEPDPFSFGLKLEVRPDPKIIVLGKPVTLIVSAADNETAAPVSGTVMINRAPVGQTGVPFTATPTAQHKRVWEPGNPDGPIPARRGRWIDELTPAVLSVHAAAPYRDASIEIGSPYTISAEPPPPTSSSRTPVASNGDGRLELFARGSDNALHHIWQTAPGAGWSGWVSLGGVVAGEPAVALNHDGRLELFARGSDNALHHIWQTAPGAGWSGWGSM